VILATVLGSGVVFLDGTVVNVALPAIGHDLHTSVTGLQWTVDAYLLTLSALLLLGGSAGDRYGRRSVFVVGLVVFSVASAACGLAPGVGYLIAARAAQGVGGALLVPGSLAIIAAEFAPEDRGRAIGAWSGLGGVASAVGPFLGGWLIDAESWRLIFFLNLPLAAVAVTVALRHVPESRAPDREPLDITGAVTVSLALAALSYAAIEHRGSGAGVALVLGLVVAALFVVLERGSDHPMLPLSMFRSAQFTGANLTTLGVYGALSVALFLVVLRLEVSLRYSALDAGASLVPFTVLMLLLSPTSGKVAQRIGARVPMTVGPLLTAAGMLLLSRVGAGTRYVSGVLPGVVVFALGMVITVAPLTAAVLASVDDARVGAASGINNAAARLAGLMAVAVLPGVAGIDPGHSLASGLDTGYSSALRIAAGLCAAGGVVAWLFVRRTAPVRPVPHPSPFGACHDPAVRA
jgi:EmrB/QacA subfamily drug resistance transporter